MTKKRNLSNDSITHIEKKGIEYIQFNHLNKYANIVSHCFSTRIGGVSSGHFSTLNIGINSDDLKQNIEENYRRLCKTVGINNENTVFSKQVHGTNIVTITSDNANNFRSGDREECDGFITREKNIALVTVYADCVPIFLFDPVKKIIALVHSGWRGTVSKIADKAVQKMIDIYNCNPEDILAGIGPSIGECCFEVDVDTANMFREAFVDCSDIINQYKNKADKFTINLWECNKSILAKCGLMPDNINIAGICTVCNNDLFFSHRASNGQKGRNAAIMQLI